MDPVWICRAERRGAAGGPLAGKQFAVKDNIDVAGLPTTAACAAFAYVPQRTAPVVEKLLANGATLTGKTNLDQFATGLVGTRSPYGICSSVYDARYISGGSSAGSAVAVARGDVDFSLGTDTAGSGRVPAAFNGIIGLKPTRGLLSTEGVVPACKSLDCVSIFARTIADAALVFRCARSRSPQIRIPAEPKIGIPRPAQLEFFGDEAAGELYRIALQKMPGTLVEIDFTPFRETAQLLYSGPWVAERFAAVGDYLDHMEPSVRTIIGGASKLSAVDAFRGMYRLEELREQVEKEWAGFDVLALPTTGTIYTIEQVQADPIRLNSNLGFYTNFVNLLDLAAVAVPAGMRPNGLPFGISLIGRASTDDALLELAANYLGETAFVDVAVVGAHLTGQPLNSQLTGRRARLLRTTRTARDYRLFALRDTVPPKPGLVREEGFDGSGIEVEVWQMPVENFGSFVAEIPPPLGIGNATLADGSIVKCFICEPWAIAGSREITSFGGWRSYISASAASK